MGTPRVDGAVGVLGESGEGDEHRLVPNQRDDPHRFGQGGAGHDVQNRQGAQRPDGHTAPD